MAIDFGRDIAMGALGLGVDIDPRFRTVTGARAVLESVARRLLTPRGALVEDPDFGIDLLQWLNAGFTALQRFALVASVAAEAEKEERVLRSDTSVSYDASSESIAIDVACQTADGPFSLVLSVSSAGVSITQAEA